MLFRKFFASDELSIHVDFAEYPVEEIHDFKTHNHLVCEMLFLIDGDICYNVEGRNYHLRRYDLIFVRPGKNHYMTFASKSVPYRRFNMLCSPKNLPKELFSQLPDDADVISFEKSERMKSIYEHIEYYADKLDYESQKMLFTSLACEIFCQFAIAARDPERRLPSSSNRTLDNALKFIDENLCEIEDINEICSALFITKSHLHHLFSENIKISPKKYINQKKLLLARKKIRRGANPTDVYRQCGFIDYTTFYRNYKSYFGYSPSLEGEATTQITIPLMNS